jgi:hypothetical protein
MLNRYDSPRLVGDGEFVIGLRPDPLRAAANILLLEVDTLLGSKSPNKSARRFLGIYNEYDSLVKGGFWTSEQAEAAALAIQEARKTEQLARQ